MSKESIKKYIKDRLIPAFNVQFGHNFTSNHFDVVSIATTSSRVAYELYTIDFHDHLRLRVYCNLGPVEKIGKFLLTDEINTSLGPPTKIFTVDVIFDEEFLYSNNNQVRKSFEWLTATEQALDILLDERTLEPILAEDGSYILNETELYDTL